MSQIKNLYDEFLNINFYENKNVLDFFIENRLIIDNSKVNDIEDLENLTSIVSHYLKALFETGYYSKCLEESIRFESHINNSENDLIKSEKVNQKNNLSIKFYKGACLYYLKKYKESRVVFSELLNEEPSNDLYKNWLSAINNKIKSGYKNFLIIIGTLIIFGKNLFNLSVQEKMTVNYFGIAFYLAYGIIELSNFIKRKNEKNHLH